MIKYMFLMAGLLLLSFSVKSQENDTSAILEEIVVKGLEMNTSRLQTPLAVTNLPKEKLMLWSSTGPLPLVSQVPGIRLEERSPMSYRIAVRGSAVRSPFGVRNVKIYFQDIPLTDATGNSYFNALSFNMLNQMEWTRGAGGSIYGAGLGGVIHLHSKIGNFSSTTPEQNWRIESSAGAFSTWRNTGEYTLAKQNTVSHVYSSYDKSDGYRSHSNSTMSALMLQQKLLLGDKHYLSWHLYYSGLDYRTPGGLTLSQMLADRTMSRPGTPFTKSAIEQNAGIFQQFAQAAVTHQFAFREDSRLSISIFLRGVVIENPFITNYEVRNELTPGWRSLWKFKRNWRKIKADFTIGSEGLVTGIQSNVYANDAGKQGEWWYDESIISFQHNLFGQMVWLLPFGTQVTSGLSFNRQYFSYNLEKPSIPGRKFSLNPAVPWTPRISVLKKFGNNFSTYLSYSRGFSTPTGQELANTFQHHPENIWLKAEKGNTLEGGLLYNHGNNRWESELVFYRTQIKDGIVRYVNADGTEFNVNSGMQLLQGIESSLKSKLISRDPEKGIYKLDVQCSFAWQRFTYLNYNPLGKAFSGNKIPGSPDLLFGSQIDAYLLRYLSVSSQINYHGSIFLDDANLISEQDYMNINTRLACNFSFGMHKISVFCSGQNILNQPINTGNDLNALGGRYYNPGIPFNVQAGVRWSN